MRMSCVTDSASGASLAGSTIWDSPWRQRTQAVPPQTQPQQAANQQGRDRGRGAALGRRRLGGQRSARQLPESAQRGDHDLQQQEGGADGEERPSRRSDTAAPPTRAASSREPSPRSLTLAGRLSSQRPTRPTRAARARRSGRSRARTACPRGWRLRRSRRCRLVAPAPATSRRAARCLSGSCARSPRLMNATSASTNARRPSSVPERWRALNR